MMNVFLSVVIPCYNEEENLKRGALDEVASYLAKQPYESEIIISDDGSTDGSLRFLRKYVKKHPLLKLLENKHAGKPFTVRVGIEKAKGKIVLFTDMDQSVPIEEVRKLLPFFKKGYDVVIGSRGVERKNAPWYRKIIARVFRRVRGFFLLSDISDTQCGFKAFRSQVAKDIFPRLLIFKEGREIKGWRVSAFDVELLFITKKRGYKIAEVLVKWEDKDFALADKEKNFVKESKEMLKEIIRVKINDLEGKYEK